MILLFSEDTKIPCFVNRIASNCCEIRSSTRQKHIKRIILLQDGFAVREKSKIGENVIQSTEKVVVFRGSHSVFTRTASGNFLFAENSS